jgi:hypothetical protein
VKPSELFGVFVRAAGFLMVIYGLWEVLSGMDNVFENILSASQGGDNNDQPSSVSYFVLGVPAVVLGAASFFLADWIVRLAYRNPPA